MLIILLYTGEVIGMCAGPMTRDDTAFIGFYAVEPQYQGVGVGRELWSKTLGHLESTLNVGLYGVPEMAEKYKKVGFTLEDSASMLVFESEPDSWDISSLDCLRQVNDARLALLDGSSSDLSLFETLVEYDSQIHGYSRRNLLCQYLLGQDTPLTVTVLDATKEPSKMLGYGIIREDNNSGGIIGPIYADNDTICEFILAQLISKFELDSGKIFSVMPLNSNTSAIEILRKIGFVQREECSRLFTKYVPKAGLSNKIYYVHSPNFSLF